MAPLYHQIDNWIENLSFRPCPPYPLNSDQKYTPGSAKEQLHTIKRMIDLQMSGIRQSENVEKKIFYFNAINTIKIQRKLVSILCYMIKEKYILVL